MCHDPLKTKFDKIAAALIGLALLAAFWGTIYWAAWSGKAHGQERAGIAETSDRDGKLEALGQKLFHDPILSSNGKVACASCHIPANGYASEGLPTGVAGKPIPRRAPSLWNCKDRTSLMWDGRAKTLEEQVLLPLLNPDEMGNKSVADVLTRTGSKYGVTTEEQLTKALAAYERTLVRDAGHFERFTHGEEDLLVEEARGWDLFRGKAGCYKCHDPKKGFTDDGFHRSAIAGDEGRAGVTKNPLDRGKFRTPQLRDCRDCGPYMHDASVKSLEDVIDLYDRGAVPEVKPLKLSAREKADLAAFLRSL
jgi:cytochrome c peroxidase